MWMLVTFGLIFAYLYGAYIVFSVPVISYRKKDEVRHFLGVVPILGYAVVLISFLVNSFLIYETFFAYEEFNSNSSWLLSLTICANVIVVIVCRAMLWFLSFCTVKGEKIASAVLLVLSLIAVVVIIEIEGPEDVVFLGVSLLLLASYIRHIKEIR